METILNSLPEYVANQVLTETSLNATSDFLEQQTRLSRFGLTKTGIIENLDYRVLRNTITINEGFGISTDGYFMPHNYKSGNVEYQFVKTYRFTDGEDNESKFISDLRQLPFSGAAADAVLSKTKYYELLTKEQAAKEAEAVDLSQVNSGNYKIVLFLEIKNISQQNCSPNSCDTGGSMRNYRVVPMIVTDPEDIVFPKINTDKALKNQIRLKRFSNLYQIVQFYTGLTAADKAKNPFDKLLLTEYSRLNFQNTATILSKLEEIKTFWDFPKSLGPSFFSRNIDLLSNAITQLTNISNAYIPKVFSQDYPYNYGFVAQQNPRSYILKATNKFYARTYNARAFKPKSNQSGVHANASVYYQYYLDFCNDLEMAVNELVLAYNSYCQRYFTSNQGRVQRFLVLGHRDRYADGYRYHAIENFSNEDFRETKNSLFRHFNRIPVLIKKFDLGFKQISYKKEIKIIPSRSGNVLLEDRAIPFYYQQDLELEKAWIVKNSKTLSTDIYQYRDLNSPYSHFVYNISSYNFMRIEGDLSALTSQKVYDASVLKKHMNFFNIPLQIKIVNIGSLDVTDQVKMWEHTGGTRVGGELILLCFSRANANGQNTTVALGHFQVLT